MSTDGSSVLSKIASSANSMDRRNAAETHSSQTASALVTANSTHAYQVALRTLRERCRKQTDQLHNAHDETKRLIADKAALHSEIDRLRSAAGRQRDRAAQLSRQLGEQQRHSRRLRRQLILQSQQLQLFRKRLVDTGLSAAASPSSSKIPTTLSVGDQMLSLEMSNDDDELDHGEDQADRDTAELHVPVATAAARDKHLTPLPATDSAGARLITDLQMMADALHQHNTALRRCMQQMSASGSVCSDKGVFNEDLSSERTLFICPICRKHFRSPYTASQFENHVYSHLTSIMLTK